jgi:hypothetical protein
MMDSLETRNPDGARVAVVAAVLWEGGRIGDAL